MKGDGRDLEGDPHQQGEDRDARENGHAAAVLPGVCGEGLADRQQVECAELAVQQGDAVDHDRAGDCTEQHVFDGGLGREPVFLAEARDGVGRQRSHFHGQQDHQQVCGADHEGHAEGTADKENEELDGVDLVTGLPVGCGLVSEIPESADQREKNRDEADEEVGELIGNQHRGAARR